MGEPIVDLKFDNVKEEFPNADIEIKSKSPSKANVVAVVVMNLGLIIAVSYLALEVTPWALLVFALGGATTDDQYEINIRRCGVE